MAKGPAGKSCSINVHFRGTNGKWLHKSTFVEASERIGDPETWRRVSLSFVLPAEASSAVVHCNASGLAPDETLRYDDAELFLLESGK